MTRVGNAHDVAEYVRGDWREYRSCAEEKIRAIETENASVGKLKG